MRFELSITLTPENSNVFIYPEGLSYQESTVLLLSLLL